MKPNQTKQNFLIYFALNLQAIATKEQEAKLLKVVDFGVRLYTLCIFSVC